MFRSFPLKKLASGNPTMTPELMHWNGTFRMRGE